MWHGVLRVWSFWISLVPFNPLQNHFAGRFACHIKQNDVIPNFAGPQGAKRTNFTMLFCFSFTSTDEKTGSIDFLEFCDTLPSKRLMRMCRWMGSHFLKGFIKAWVKGVF